MDYIEDKIIFNSWGFEQTNIDFYKILKRKGDFVTLLPLLSDQQIKGDTMTGTCTPGKMNPQGEIIRRKVHYRNGKEIGLQIKSYGWAQLWDGEPCHFSFYG